MNEQMPLLVVILLWIMGGVIAFAILYVLVTVIIESTLFQGIARFVKKKFVSPKIHWVFRVHMIDGSHKDKEYSGKFSECLDDIYRYTRLRDIYMIEYYGMKGTQKLQTKRIYVNTIEEELDF